MKMRGAVKAGFTLVAALVLTGALAAVPARAARPQEPYSPGPNPTLLQGYCQGFDVSVLFRGLNQYVISQSTAADGTITMRVTGRASATLTNTMTGASVSYNISGPGVLTIDPDGSFSANLAGPNLLWTLPANLPDSPAVPAISYTTGHVTFAVAASGKTTSYSLAGGARQTDVCAVLAP
jgi:hypothetical protein